MSSSVVPETKIAIVQMTDTRPPKIATYIASAVDTAPMSQKQMYTMIAVNTVRAIAISSVHH